MNLSWEVDGASIAHRALPSRQVDRFSELIAATCDGDAGIRNLAIRIPEISSLAHSEELRKLLPNPELEPVRFLLFDKTPAANWPVAWHQDRTICVAKQVDAPGYGPWTHKNGIPHVEPPLEILQNMVTLRIHLDPAPASNGCLRIIPGSHRMGKLPPEERERLMLNEAVDCECDSGDILTMRPLLLHSSRRALSPSHRRVIHIEYGIRSQLHENLDWAE